MSDALWTTVHFFNYLVLGYFVLLNLVYLGTSFFAFGALRRYTLRMKLSLIHI